MASEVLNLNVSFKVVSKVLVLPSVCMHFLSNSYSLVFLADTLLVTETGYELLTARTNEPVMTWNEDLISR